jgi:Zn finger protein HypA/HybF involved in hydrogenase expression
MFEVSIKQYKCKKCYSEWYAVGKQKAEYFCPYCGSRETIYEVNTDCRIRLIEINEAK